MTVDYKNHANDSYDRCIAELRARYSGRGVSVSFKNEIAAQAKKENAAKTAAAKAPAQESFVLFNSGNKIGDQYRSGEYKGSKYMTSDDFVRYFKSRRAFYMPAALKAQEAEAEAAKQNSAVPQRKGNGASSRGLTRSDSGKEGHIRGLLSAALELAKKWFPMEPREGRVDNTSFRIPAAAITGIAVFVVSLGMIVGGSVMVGSASGEVGKLNRQISLLEAEQTDLQSKLDLKYNISEIEEDAKALGMIKREYADNEYIEVISREEIEIYGENEDKDLNLTALLASFGIKID